MATALRAGFVGLGSMGGPMVQRMIDDPKLPPVFDQLIPEANQIAASAEYQSYSTLRQKYGYQGQFDAFRALTVEFMETVEAAL